jgi:hypothetical protein
VYDLGNPKIVLVLLVYDLGNPKIVLVLLVYDLDILKIVLLDEDFALDNYYFEDLRMRNDYHNDVGLDHLDKV